MSYTNRQNQWVELYNIKPGTVVKIMDKYESRKDGWKNSWVNQMDKYVGQEHCVHSIDGESGISLGEFHFPYFVLFPVLNSKSFLYQVNGEWGATYNHPNDFIKIGCQKIPINNIKQLIKEIDEINGNP